MSQQEIKGKGRKQLVLLIAVFAAPIAMAWIVFSNQALITGKTKNHGELVTPARPLGKFALQNIDGSSTDVDDVRKKWSLVYIGDRQCPKECADTVYKMRQSRLGQKGEHGRINLLYVSINGEPGTSVKDLRKQTPVLQILYTEEKQAGEFADMFSVDGQIPTVNSGHVYMIDPQGNLMMIYRQGFEAKGLAKDLELLLKISQVG